MVIHPNGVTRAHGTCSQVRVARPFAARSRAMAAPMWNPNFDAEGSVLVFNTTHINEHYGNVLATCWFVQALLL